MKKKMKKKRGRRTRPARTAPAPAQLLLLELEVEVCLRSLDDCDLGAWALRFFHFGPSGGRRVWKGKLGF